MDLDIKTIRMMWAFVETSNPHTLLKLSDSELIQNLLKQVESITPLSGKNNQLLSQYVSLRTLLIRELAYAKISP